MTNLPSTSPVFTSPTTDSNNSPAFDSFLDTWSNQVTTEGIREAAEQLLVNECIRVETEAADNNEEARYTSNKRPEARNRNRRPQTFAQHLSRILSKTDFLVTYYVMAMVVLWVVSVLIHWLGSIHGQLLTRPSASPRPFFPEYARELVVDHYTGNGASPVELLRRGEIVVLMYYAPWSLESKDARRPFIDVASAFETFRGVKFFAVNCNTRLGDCKKQFRVHKYPTIVAYVGKVHASYPGVVTTTGLFSFVRHLVDPVTKVSSYDEIAVLSHQFDLLVVGYFPFDSAEHIREYSTFLATAIRSYGISEYLIRFIVVQDDHLAQFHLKLDLENRLRVVSTQHGLSPLSLSPSYEFERSTTSSDLIKWFEEILTTFSGPQVRRLHLDDLGSNGKSEVLQITLNQSSTVVLFSNDFYSPYEPDSLLALRRTAKAFFTCSNKTGRPPEASDEESSRTPHLSQLIATSQAACRKLTAAPSHGDVQRCCMSLLRNGACRRRLEEDSTTAEDDSIDEHEEISERCDGLSRVFSSEELTQKCCYAPRFPKITQQLFEVTWQQRLDCEWYRTHRRAGSLHSATPPAFLPSEDSFHPKKVQNQGCSNESMSFIVVDRGLASPMLQNLQLNVTNDTLAIVSNEREAMYVLHKPITQNSADEFVADFLSEKLEGYRVSTPPREPVEDVTLVRMSGSDLDRFLKQPRNYDTFLVVVGGRWHAASTAIGYVIHSAAMYFSEFGEMIKFAIIDASTNDLPIPYSFDRLPAALFFPATSNVQIDTSTRFPVNMPFSVPNILAFVLSRSQLQLRWRIALSSCPQTCIKRNWESTQKFIDGINRALRRFSFIRAHVAKKRQFSIEKIAQIRVSMHSLAMKRRAAVQIMEIIRLMDQQSEANHIMTPEKWETVEHIIDESIFIRWIIYQNFGF